MVDSHGFSIFILIFWNLPVALNPEKLFSLFFTLRNDDLWIERTTLEHNLPLKPINKPPSTEYTAFTPGFYQRLRVGGGLNMNPLTCR